MKSVFHFRFILIIGEKLYLSIARTTVSIYIHIYSLLIEFPTGKHLFKINSMTLPTIYFIYIDSRHLYMY